MLLKLLVIILLDCTASLDLYNTNIVCYYDSRSYSRNGIGFMDAESIKPALRSCTHLIYGFARLNPENFTIEPLDEDLDVVQGYYNNITSLKYDLPSLKVLLSVGGNADVTDPDKYLKLLETRERRTNFVDHAAEYLKKYNFDGIDLAWQFPTVPPEIPRSKIGTVWNNIKKYFSSNKNMKLDVKEKEHRDGFTNLISYMKPIFERYFLMFTITNLPNVNASAYFYVPTLKYYVDFVNLMAFDYYNPTRYPTRASYPAPLYEDNDRQPFENVNFLARYWIGKGMPREKLILALPTFARTWKIKKISTSASPPFEADGPGNKGRYTLQAGLLAKYEYCPRSNVSNLREGSSSSGSHIVGNNGWEFVGYDTSNVIEDKLKYVVNNQLGGIALYELSLDDFQGICNGNKYPLLNEMVKSLKKM